MFGKHCVQFNVIGLWTIEIFRMESWLVLLWSRWKIFYFSIFQNYVQRSSLLWCWWETFSKRGGWVYPDWRWWLIYITITIRTLHCNNMFDVKNFNNVVITWSHFCSGLPRTGTLSTYTALEMLLPGKCHHMLRFPNYRYICVFSRNAQQDSNTNNLESASGSPTESNLFQTK